MTPGLDALAARLPSSPLTRFAPSPTGHLHLGHVVNAIHVWGIARGLGGRVLLRVEDHDRARSRSEYEQFYSRGPRTFPFIEVDAEVSDAFVVTTRAMYRLTAGRDGVRLILRRSCSDQYSLAPASTEKSGPRQTFTG